MAVLKCKMCGGDLNIGVGESVGICEFCGTKQTLPKLDNDRKNNLYDRANHFRRNNEYDKAMAIFENILNEDNTDAESYWSLVLCKYGIEYVEDPVSHKRVPTVNRAQFTSVFADENYKSALKYADSNQRSIYEEEAKAIDEIQKGILAISQKEKPFDVFICYKETDPSGSRTKDSVIANELYHELTKEGFKVFFSRITLEDKLGTAYEPYIFAALNSSKVMVVIGTKPEYFNAVWVKNEWSRYLALIRNGERKMLIPAYRDMDPYDLPEEFSHLQAQDMSKLGFMQDLIRGIKKITAVDEPAPVTTVVKETVVQQAGGNATVDSLLKRVFIFLEDKDFVSANEYAEKVLDIDPENAQAYLGKLLADCKVDKLSNLVNYKDSFESNNNYQKVCRYGDKELGEKLEGFIKAIKDRNEEARKLGIYSDAVNLMNKAQTVADFNKAAERFASISGYKDSKELKDKCRQLAEETQIKIEYNDARSRMSINSVAQYRNAISILEKIADYKDSKELIEKCKDRIEELNKESLYRQALLLCARNNVQDQERAIECLEGLKGYKDSESLIDSCRKYIEKIKADELNAKAAAVKKKKTMKIVGISAASAVALAIVIALLLNTVIMPAVNYGRAVELEESGDIKGALRLYSSLGDYKDSEEKHNLYLSEVNKSEGKTVAVSDKHIIAVKNDGTVVADGNNSYSGCDVDEWTDICAVSVGDDISFGLKNDGTVVTTGWNAYDRFDVREWTDIIAISTGKYHVVGLKSDGTVVAKGKNVKGECNVEEWKDIISISACEYCTVGVKADGTIVLAGEASGATPFVTSDWSDIVEVSVSEFTLLGLKSDGTVVATGGNSANQCEVGEWKDIVNISASNLISFGVNEDDKVLAQGINIPVTEDSKNWTDIVDIINNGAYFIGLKSDGSLVTAGECNFNDDEVSKWTDIMVK